jgi:ABC-type branched-subunit amino acid transport system permease subunit
LIQRHLYTIIFIGIIEIIFLYVFNRVITEGAPALSFSRGEKLLGMQMHKPYGHSFAIKALIPGGWQAVCRADIRREHG